MALTPEQYLNRVAYPERGDPKLTARAAALTAASERGANIDGYTSEDAPGTVRVYRCGICGGRTYTLSRHGGKVPDLLGCRATGAPKRCPGFAVLVDEPVPAGTDPQWEWYIPAAREIRRQKRAFPSVFRHVRSGGLILRPRTPKPRVQAVEEYAPPRNDSASGTQGKRSR